MKFKALLLLTVLVAQSTVARDVLWGRENDERLLPELVELAHKDGDKVYNLVEIYDGVSQTAVIRKSERCHNTYSVAKLFTCTVIGILQDQGKLDFDDAIFPILEKKFPEQYDPKWRVVTLADVVRHRTGFGETSDKLDIDVVNSATWDRDFLKIVLSQPLPNQPGEKYYYTDATFYLAARVASEITREPINITMARELLEPLHFAEYAFSTDPEGFPIAATGMYIATEDMAKLGQLYVQDGVFDGKRILSKEFVDEAFARNFELYQVDEEGNAFIKGGMNGQLLYMNRKTKRVVAIHSYGADTDAFVKFLVERDR